MHRQTRLLLGALLLAAVCTEAVIHDPRAVAADPATASGPIAPRLEGLGEHSHAVTTASAESQHFFDQGLRLTYGFNHSEALRSFKEAIRLDPGNAMAYWGWALVLGPNLNLPMQPDVTEQAYRAAQAAVALRDTVSDAERAYIDALAERYAPVAPNDRTSLDRAYAEAMGQLAAEYPDDLDAQTLYGAALMNLSPWDYWHKDGRPKAHTEAILRAFESVIATNPRHPGALHYYIHAVEAVHPRRGEASADALADLMPGAGHMLHMPSHIYMRVGRYADSLRANQRASAADAGYISQCKAQGIYPLLYYPHNLHFAVWSAMFMGQSETAMAGARVVQDKVPETLSADAFGMFETFLSQPLYVMVRFGRWHDVLAEPKPIARHQFMTGVWRYARALALSNTGKRRDAERELKALRSLIDDLPAGYAVGFSAAPKLLTIAEHVAAADLAAKRGDTDEAVALAARAVRLEDSLLYNEPPDWYFPTRHVLGAMLLEAGSPDEAAVVYWEDLRKNPGNGFALRGLAQALEAQGDATGAAAVAADFDVAWAAADVELRIVQILTVGLVTADDRSGAFETGGAIAEAGFGVRVGATVDAAAECAIVDIASRHVSAADAAARVVAAHDVAADWHCHKMDSVLRGNWPAEAIGLAEAGLRVAVVPSFPAAGRTCVDGLVRVHGVPVADSAFGRDARRPLPSSRPREFIEVAGGSAALRDGAIVVLDAADASQLRQAARRCRQEARLLVGTTGAIGAFADSFGRPRSVADHTLSAPTLIVCGSLNPLSRTQIKRLSCSKYSLDGDSNELVRKLIRELASGAVVVLESVPVEGPVPDDRAEQVATELADVATAALADVPAERTAAPALVVIGGDTAAALLGPRPVTVLGNLATSVAIGELEGRTLVVKGGGMGDENTLRQLLQAAA